MHTQQRYSYNDPATSISPHSFPLLPHYSHWQRRKLWRVILGFSSRSDEGEQPRRSPLRINEIYIFPTARRLPPGSAAGRLDILRYTYESAVPISDCTSAQGGATMHACGVCFFSTLTSPGSDTAQVYSPALSGVRFLHLHYKETAPNAVLMAAFYQLSSSGTCPWSCTGNLHRRVTPGISNLRIFSR